MRMQKQYKQLRYEERIQIESLHRQGKSIRYIARVLERSPNTVSNELKHRRVKGMYIPKKAQHKAYYKRYLSKRACMKVAMNPSISVFVKEKLALRWSPERISGYLKLKGEEISVKAVYKYIYSRGLDHHLFWKKNRMKTGRKKYRNTLKMSRNFIDRRPILIGSGHLEADFIVSSHNTCCLLVVVDRYSRYVWIKKLENRKHVLVTRAFQSVMKEMKIKSITVDNDIAFSGWMQLEKILKTKIYFTHPYHSWEKGLVENSNRWIRVYIPKKRDIRTVSQKELHDIQTFLNTVPRKIIGFRSASELLLENVKCPS
jgi:transposase, IS30 family